MTVGELRQRMSCAEFSQWVALEELREYEREKERKKAERKSRSRSRR